MRVGVLALVGIFIVTMVQGRDIPELRNPADLHKEIAAVLLHSQRSAQSVPVKQAEQQKRASNMKSKQVCIHSYNSKDIGLRIFVTVGKNGILIEN